MLRDIPELVAEMGGDPERIYAYHDQYPKNVSLVHAIHEMPAPSIMAVWQGTQPGTFGGVDVWKHQITLFLRAKETFDGDPPTAYYRLFRLITKGVPTAAGVEMLTPPSIPPATRWTCPRFSGRPMRRAWTTSKCRFPSRRLETTDSMCMAAPAMGRGRTQEVEAKPEVIGPLMVAGWSQCEPPANTQEVTTHVDD